MSTVAHDGSSAANTRRGVVADEDVSVWMDLDPPATTDSDTVDIELQHQHLLQILRDIRDLGASITDNVVNDLVAAQSALGEILLLEGELVDFVLLQEAALIELDKGIEESPFKTVASTAV